MVENRKEVYAALCHDLQEEEEKLEHTQLFHGLDDNQKILARQCYKINRRLEEIEEEKYDMNENHKLSSLALDKKIGMGRIKLKIA